VHSKDQSLTELWRSVNYLSGVGDGALDDLARNSALATFDQGEIIFLQDDPQAGIFLVESGAVKI